MLDDKILWTCAFDCSRRGYSNECWCMDDDEQYALCKIEFYRKEKQRTQNALSAKTIFTSNSQHKFFFCFNVFIVLRAFSIRVSCLIFVWDNK